MAKTQDYLPRPQVAKRYGVTERSIARWESEYDIGFPKAMVVNGRRFFRIAALEQWEKDRASSKEVAA